MESGKRNIRHERRIKKLIVLCGLCGMFLIISTYAWFIGMKTVDVSSFDVTIASIDSLSLSLDGESWSDVVKINKSNYKLEGTKYRHNTNSWGGEGLIPMSSVGKIDTESSRLIMYEKASLTPTTGGYRIMASEVKNKGATEADGYVAFDLFIKNLSGNEYYEELTVLNEEAIYLTPNSEVKVSSGGVSNTGIENSVRVAFAQIGRVKADTEEIETITGITCKTKGNVIGICEDRDSQIWEPNDTKHVDNAISWYKTSCLKRTGDNILEPDSFGGECNNIENGISYETYAISDVIDYSDQVDVYDGEDYNGYTKNMASISEDGKLVSYPYFTDTMKNMKGTDRPTFINLAPNSITKVRVYVYIEGQDIDNYDFASLGKQISVSFGFTKERFYGEDFGYNEGEEKGPEIDNELQQRPINKKMTTYINSLCENTETCNNNNIITDVDGNLRFSGTSNDVDNRVYYNCEGTDDYGVPYGDVNYDYYNSCEVWRMIGLIDDGTGNKRIKIINTASTFESVWDSSSVNDGKGINQWGESTLTDGSYYEGADIKSLLNGYYIGKTGAECMYCTRDREATCTTPCDTASKPLSSLKMKPLTDNAKQMINVATWNTYGVHSDLDPLNYNNSEIAYLQEKGFSTQYDGLSLCVGCDEVVRTTSWTGLVGLMSVGDAAYANGWLNSSGNPWTMTPYIYPNVSMPVWRSKSSGASGADPVFVSRVWPTVYLDSNVKVVSGNGDNNPYKLSI